MGSDHQFVLNQFYSSTSKKEDLVMSITLKEFCERPDLRKIIMDQYSASIQAEAEDVTGAYIAGWLGSLTAAFTHLRMFHEESMNIDLGAIEMEFYPSNHHTNYFLHFHYDIQPSESKPTFEQFFSCTITPVLKAIEEESRIRLDYLWKLVIPGIFWAEKSWVKHDIFSKLQDQIEETINEIHALPPEVFSLKKNPYLHEFVELENPWDPEGKLWRKPVCCLAYKTANHGYCYTCPRMKPADRAEKYHQIREQLKEKKEA
ncbi:(2Fe-2S)-binding protein [Mangrovibacillus cuniculi]|uniref:(2Fe-2S)-binding protein n=1 Tax=Mangrovibacillus cuniculi TaxID=2593652 RepID=A0A7S8CDR5_9BACI|nr:(2Fe-2S)-binding protein [Mangrovibacillus cuniculi]QPC48105.1 (2Fe-2S)-binding protein [Mangrovibacillus cuniculi]